LVGALEVVGALQLEAGADAVETVQLSAVHEGRRGRPAVSRAPRAGAPLGIWATPPPSEDTGAEIEPTPTRGPEGRWATAAAPPR